MEGDFSLWLLNMAFCRFIARPETIMKIGTLSFDRKNNEAVFKKLKELPAGKYGNPYVFPISVIMRSKFPTREEFFCFYLPLIIPKVSKLISEFQRKGVSEGLAVILPAFGYNLKFH
jgi:hypothetical protein